MTIDTLRADHLGSYGYRHDTSPHIDALAREGTLFEHAFSYWPKTRGSFVMIHAGRFPSGNGFESTRFALLGPFDETIASCCRAPATTRRPWSTTPTWPPCSAMERGRRRDRRGG